MTSSLDAEELPSEAAVSCLVLARQDPKASGLMRCHCVVLGGGRELVQ